MYQVTLRVTARGPVCRITRNGLLLVVESARTVEEALRLARVQVRYLRRNGELG